MKVSTERIPESQVLMTIEVEAERVADARARALRKLSPRAKVPGFRPGKAPPDLVRRYFGEERILDEALDALVPVIYREAVEADESIVPVARPRLVVETTEPLVVKATIPVRPTVELGDYRDVRVPAEPVTVDQTRVEDTLLLLRRRVATLEPIERGLSWRDVTRLDVSGVVDGETLVEQKDVEVQLVEERDVLFPGFEEALIGHSKGETFEFDLDVPAEVKSEKFAGKQCHFTATIHETKEEVLPELDDEFAKQVGDGFESVDMLRERIRDDIQRADEEQRDNRLHDQIMSALVERATVEYPPVMLDAEVDRLLHDQAGHIQRGEDLERYLAGVGKTEEQVRGELRPIAETRLRRSLVLSKVAEVEDIEVADDEVGREIEKMTASAGPQGEQLRQMFESENGRETIRRSLLTRKTLARLIEIATPGPDLKSATTRESAEVKPKRKAIKKGEAKAPDMSTADKEATAAGATVEE